MVVIDSDYRDPVSVILFSFSNKFIQIKEGERYAQIVFEKISIPTLRKTENF